MVTVIAAVIPAVVAGSIPVTIPIVPMIDRIGSGRRAPATVCPDPMVVAPSPTSTHPYVTWYWASRCDRYNRRRHRRPYHDWRSHDDRSRNRESKVKADTYPGVSGGSKSNSGQGQNCDSLFHSFHKLYKVRRGSLTELRYNWITVL
jgi:hypothetical protein